MTASSDGLPKGWSWKRLDEIVEKGSPILYGILQPGPNIGDGVPYIRPTEITDNLIDLNALRRTSANIAAKYKRSTLQAQDVILSIVGTIGKVAIVPASLDGGNITQSSVRIRAQQDFVLAEYIAWALRSPILTRQYDQNRLGTAVPRLNVAHVRALRVPVAPRDQQPQIVAEIEKQFTRLDAGVAALRRVQANLKRYRAAVLKAACEGKLVPTEAELHRQGKVAKFESGEELLERILAARRKNWSGRGKYKEPAAPEAINLSPLPEGWTWASVVQLGGVQLGRQRSPKNASKNHPTKYIRAANITEHGIDVSDVLEMEFSPEERERFMLRDGDIVLSEASGSPAHVGKPAVWRNELPLCCFQNTVLRLRPNVVESKYVLTVFLHFWLSGVFAKVAGGVGINHLGAEKFSMISFPLPSLAEQTRIVAEVERRLSVIDELEAVVTANLQRAARLRQSILQKAFSGELLAGNNEVPEDKIVKFPKAPAKPLNKHFARAVLSAEIVHRLHDHPTFGRIKHQKIFHLCEYIAQIPEIEGQYHREAAGPFDNKLIYANEAELKKQKWFRSVERENFGHAYEAMEKAGAHRKYAEGAWPEKLATIDKLLDLMRKWSTDSCEIFCTTYAAWNDLIILGKKPTEDAILNEVLNRWHPSKKRFPEDRWRKAIGWMRENGYEPTGFGKATKLR